MTTKIALAIGSTFLTLVLLDRALGLVGLPEEVPMRIAHQANLTEERSSIEFQYVFQTNSQGLRYREIPLAKSISSHRVMVIGDSMTEGYGVSEGMRFTDLLEQHFSAEDESVLFVNGGLSGTGPLEYGRTFLNVGLRYDPDAVLLCVFPNDLPNTPTTATPRDLYRSVPDRTGAKKLIHDLLPRIYVLLKQFRDRREFQRKTRPSDFIETVSDEAARLGIPRERIDQWKAAVPPSLAEAVSRGEIRGSILAYGLLSPNHWTDSNDIATSTAEAKWRSMNSILSELILQSRRREIQVGIVYIPAPLQYDGRFHASSNIRVLTGTIVDEAWLRDETELQIRLRDSAAQANVPFLDLTPVFRAAVEGDELLNWELDGHWTPAGHAVASQAIADWLVGEQVFSFLNN